MGARGLKCRRHFLVERMICMEYAFLYTLYSNNILYSVMAVVVIICGIVWLGKQVVTAMLKIMKIFLKNGGHYEN